MESLNFNAFLCMIFIVAYEPHPQSHLQVSVYTVSPLEIGSLLYI